MKKLLVTGASGLLGWNVCRAAVRQWHVTGTCLSRHFDLPGVRTVSVDLRDRYRVRRLFHDLRPDALIHAAAASKPEDCQRHPAETYRINVEASVTLAALCAQYHIPCVFTSTDLVFDGENPPYSEQDPVSPRCVYGRQKVLAEQWMTACYPAATICRMALMFGAVPPGANSFLQTVLSAIHRKEDIHLLTDEYRTPLSAAAAAGGLLLALDHPNALFHLGGGQRISRYEFGRLVARTFAAGTTHLKPCRISAVKTSAPRAADVALDAYKARSAGFRPLPIEAELAALKQTVPMAAA